MAGNTLGKLFAVTNFGESHGPAIGAVVDGCPAGLALSVEDIQTELDRRRPGTSRHVTQRREADQVEILSGVYEGKTTGTPIRSEEHTSELQSRGQLVCRLLLDKKKKKTTQERQTDVEVRSLVDGE